ncbi:MAG: hypothetical protein ABR510_04765 [Trueperaceae bacterium]
MAERPPHDALFALALARAEAYLERARPPADASPEAIRRALEPWALKTRFASRVDLMELARALAERGFGRGPRS